MTGRFLLPAIPLPLIHSYYFAANVLPYSGRRTLVATVYVFRYVVRAAFLPAHNTLPKRPRSKSTLVSLFPGFYCIFVFKTDGNFSSSGRLLFFRFCVCKGNYSLHCECKDRHSVFVEKSPHRWVVFYRTNPCIHSVITLFFAHQKSKTDCDADGSDQKKTQYNGNKQKSQHQLSFKMRTFSKNTTPNVEKF